MLRITSKSLRRTRRRDFNCLLGLGMAAGVDLLQMLIHHLGIHLSGGDVTVSHQLLNRAQIRTIFQQMYGETVAQSVGRDLLVDPGGDLIVLQDLLEPLAAHSGSADVHK